MKISLTHIILCDDVRQEAGNKLSYMGIYADKIYVNAFPFTFPKFCIISTWKGNVEKCSLDIFIKKLNDKNPIAKIENIILSPPKGSKSFTFFSVFTPLTFRSNGVYAINFTFKNRTKNSSRHKFIINTFSKKGKS